MAKRILIAQALLLAGLGIGLVVRELPGLKREIRIWRMTGWPMGCRRG